jgi:hypothetical protein
MRRSVLTLIVVVLCLTGVACRKLAEAQKPTGPLTFESVKFADAIPQEYGTLVGVTQNPERVEWVMLWFQKPDGTVYAVPVNGKDGKFGERILKFTRK